MPHKNQIHLPSWESQKRRYEKTWDLQRGNSWNYKIWNEEFSNVVIPKVCMCKLTVLILMSKTADLKYLSTVIFYSNRESFPPRMFYRIR